MTILNADAEVLLKRFCLKLPEDMHICMLVFKMHEDGSMCSSEVFTSFGADPDGVRACAARMVETVEQGTLVEEEFRGPEQ